MRPISMALAVALLAGGVAGCREQTSEDPPVLLQRNMYDQERYNPESYSAFFPDHRTMRPLADGVIANDQETDPQVATGRLEDEKV